uniref:Sushi domain-containing protein n=1 Tax=Meloidogyne hapla TaxID=6305 RepID=A0A1I8BH60_MELHA
MPHGRKVRLQCFRGFKVIGEELSECFRGRLLRPLGRCDPEKFRVMFVKCKFNVIATWTYSKADMRNAASSKDKLPCINGEWSALLLPCIQKLDDQERSKYDIIENKSLIGNKNMDECYTLRLPKEKELYNIDVHLGGSKNDQQQKLNSSYAQIRNILRQPGVRFPASTSILLILSSVNLSTNCQFKFKPPFDSLNYVNDITAPRLNVFHEQSRQFVLFNQNFPNGSRLLFSCANYSMDLLRGPSQSFCRNGEWLPPPPYCQRLDFTRANDQQPPPIDFRVDKGQWSISPLGKLLVSRSATIRLFCIYPIDNEQQIQPRWESFSNYRNYPQLTVLMAQPEDSGPFHCILPNNRRNSLHLQVRDEYCTLISNSSPTLHIHYSSNAGSQLTNKSHLFLGTVAQFSCSPGYQILNQRPLAKLHCQVSSYRPGGSAHCSCDPSHELIGNATFKCGLNGQWEEELPKCREIKCSMPSLLAPISVKAHIPSFPTTYMMNSSSEFSVGHLLLLQCPQSYLLTASSDSGSGSDSSSEAEFRPPAGLAIKAIRRRMALRSSPRKCLLSSLKSPQTSPKKCSQNSPAKHSSPSKLIQNTQNYVKSKTPLKILMKSRCSTGNQKKLNCTSPVKENSAEVNSKFVRTSKQNSSSEPIDDIPNNLNNKGSPLKLKKKLAKYCLNKCDNDKMHPHKRKIASRVSSPEFEPLKKARSAALGKKLLIDSDQMFSSFAVKDHRMAFSPKLNDYSNPFDEEGFDEEKRHLNINKLRMRDLIDLYRFLNCPDIYGFCRRPVYRPFLIRNLFYMRKQQPCDLFIDAERSVMENSYEKVILKQLRTGSRASDKIPTTVKFTLIRNYNCFGHKTAIVQCYHVTELNGRFSQLKRIPSANFEKAVNERISSYIDIDMLEECQISALEDRNSRAEHFVVRVVFRLEDAEIGGRHLRKMASRQSGESSTKLLRKNGPNDDREVVMFGSVRIFSFTPDQGLRVLTGEASILLNTATEMGLDDLNTKSSVGQVTRLIHSARNRSGRGSIPFIRIIALNEEEEEAEAEKAESERQKCDSPMRFVGSSFERRSLDRMVVGLLKMEMDVADSTASSSLLTNEEGSKNITSAKNRQQMQKGLLELPEKIV